MAAKKKIVKREAVTFKEATGSLIQQLQDHSRAIANHRDAIRELIGEYEDIADRADDCIVSLNEAVDKISEVV